SWLKASSMAVLRVTVTLLRLHAELKSMLSFGSPLIWGTEKLAVGKTTVQGVCGNKTRDDKLPAKIMRSEMLLRYFGLCIRFRPLGGLFILGFPCTNTVGLEKRYGQCSVLTG